MPIKQAQASDVEYIMRWLEGEYRTNDGGFFCNESVIHNHFKHEELYVFLDDSQCAVGFITGPTAGPSILSVKEDRRKQGVGRELAEFIIGKAREENTCVMHIQCEPQSSVPFWKKMGFEILRPSRCGYIYASLTLGRTHCLPTGVDVSVSIKFYPESKLYESNVTPLLEANPRAIREDGSLIILAERALLNRTTLDSGDVKDPVVSICVDGEEIYCDKAKYPKAENIGIQRQNCIAFYIDQIRQ